MQRTRHPSPRQRQGLRYVAVAATTMLLMLAGPITVAAATEAGPIEPATAVATSPPVATEPTSEPTAPMPTPSTHPSSPERTTRVGPEPITTAKLKAPEPGSGQARPAAPTAAEVTLNVASYDFGEVMVGTIGYTDDIVILNTGDTDVTITDRSVIGQSPADQFSLDEHCSGSVLSPGEGCSLYPRYEPDQLGGASGTLMVSTDIAGSEQVALSGTAVAVPASVSPASTDFGQVPVGGFEERSLTVTNTASTTMHTGRHADDGPFRFGDGNCQEVAPGADCTITVTFHPEMLGPASDADTLGIVFDGTSSRAELPVQFSGVGTKSIISVDTDRVDFGDVTVDGPALPEQTLRITGTSGTAPISLDIEADGPFQTEGCDGVVIAPSGRCDLTVRLGAVGFTYGELHVVGTSAGVSERVQIPLSGHGIAQTPILAFAPANVDFGEVEVGSTSAVRHVFLTNTSTTLTLANSDLEEAGLPEDPNYAVVEYCDQPDGRLAPGESCPIGIVFRPLRPGRHTDTLDPWTGADTDGASRLTGVGIEGGTPVLAFEPAGLDFGAVATGSHRNLPVTITNTADYPVSFVLAASTPFGTDQCVEGDEQALGPGASCTVWTSFTPERTGEFDGRLEVSRIAAVSGAGVGASTPGTAAIALRGASPSGVPSLSINPESLVFGTVDDPVTETVTVRYASGAPVTVSPTVPGPWTSVSDCDVIQAGRHCTVEVTIDPATTSPGVYAGDLRLDIDPPSGPVRIHTIAMSATIPPDGVHLVAEPGSVDFGEVPIGTGPGLRQITIHNAGTEPVDLDYASVTGAEFGSGSVRDVLDPGQSTSLVLRFTPLTPGAKTALLTFRIDDDNRQGPSEGDTATLTIPLAGTGTGDPAIQVSPEAVDFGPVPIGETSTPHDLTVTNRTDSQIDLAFPNVVSPFRATTSPGADPRTCAGYLNAGESCRIRLAFVPHTAGPASGTAEISVRGRSGGRTTVATIDLAGIGVTGTDPGSGVGPAKAQTGSGARHETTLPDTGTEIAWWWPWIAASLAVTGGWLTRRSLRPS